MTDIATAVERAETEAKKTPRALLRDLLAANADSIGQSLPTGYSRDRFVRLLLTAANTNPELFKCDEASFLGAGIAAAQLGLEPNDARGLAYLVPFKDRRRGRIVNLIIGYRGMLDLARRSGLVSSINAFPVYADDTFDYSLGLHPVLRHVPGEGDEEPEQLTHVYAVARVQGDAQFVVLTRRQIDKVRDQFARSTQSPWHTHYVEMALKTALRRLCKWLPQTVEMAQVIDAEDRNLALGTDVLFGGHSDTDDAIDTTADEPDEIDEPAEEAGQ